MNETLATLETKTLSILQWVKIRQAIESKMDEMNSASEWAEEKGYSSAEFYQNEFASFSDILKLISK